MKNKTTQIEIIKQALLDGKEVTSVTAFKDYCITRLASIIDRLRKRGWPIITTRNKKNGFASYSVDKNWKP